MGRSQGDEGAADVAVRVAGVLPRARRAPAAGADVQGAPALGRSRRALPPRAPRAAPGRHLHEARAQLPRRPPARGAGPAQGRQRRLREASQGAPTLVHAQSRRLPTIR